jgi:hypothetical protein
MTSHRSLALIQRRDRKNTLPYGLTTGIKKKPDKILHLGEPVSAIVAEDFVEDANRANCLTLGCQFFFAAA